MDRPDLTGLTSEQVIQSRKQHGSNRLYLRPRRQIFRILGEVAEEPVFLLLMTACILYFAIGDKTEAWMMLGAVIFVIAIEIVQEYRSERALEALRAYAQPKARVIRNGNRETIDMEEVVVGDLLEFDEGDRLAADGLLEYAHDLSIDESVLTGESLPVEKSVEADNRRVFQGATAVSGMGIARVTAVGNATEFGKLGKFIEKIESEPTPLQKQINRFVRQMLTAGAVAFIAVFILNYLKVNSLLEALLFSLAFAMALVPEEIPVAFATFMGLGAYRLTRDQVLVKQPKTVESLGSATVICLDKTGTITENRMAVADVYDFSGKDRTLEYALWASEFQPFDTMEKAILEAWQAQDGRNPRDGFRMIQDYPLGGQPPMMTHVYESADGRRIVAAKGAAERIMRVCKLEAAQLEEAKLAADELAGRGFRVLGVCSAEAPAGEFPEEQDDFQWQFEGFVALYDPPKADVKAVFDQFYQAGIQVKMITGDHPATALNIAAQSGLQVLAPALTGQEVMDMPETELTGQCRHTQVFARMFPEAKLRVIRALQAGGEVVAMTGDGVNDGPALKAAQIGVAMGKRGTEVAKGAATMILLDDNLGAMINAIAAGRKIYDNLRKAFRYIISIHLPIVLVVAVPLVLDWKYLHILTPIHVIFLELIMDPTCAIAFENEPMEANTLKKPPRRTAGNLFSGAELLLSIIQGLVITAGILGLYIYAVGQGASEEETRTYVFLTLIASNIFLTLADRSVDHSFFQTVRYRNPLIWWILGIATAILLAVAFVPAIQSLFKTTRLPAGELLLCLAVAFGSVVWFEVWKSVKKSQSRK